MPLALHRHALPPILALKRKTSSTSLLTCSDCEKTINADDGIVGWTCPECVSLGFALGTAILGEARIKEWQTLLPANIVSIYRKAKDTGDAVSVATVHALRAQYPKEVHYTAKEFDAELEKAAPRTLQLARPARALPNPPPPPPRVFRKIAIYKPKPTHATPIKDAVFLHKITVNGKKPAPLLLRRPDAPATPRPAPAVNGAKLFLKRTAPPEI